MKVKIVKMMKRAYRTKKVIHRCCDWPHLCFAAEMRLPSGQMSMHDVKMHFYWTHISGGRTAASGFLLPIMSALDWLHLTFCVAESSCVFLDKCFHQLTKLRNNSSGENAVIFKRKFPFSITNYNLQRRSAIDISDEMQQLEGNFYCFLSNIPKIKILLSSGIW